LHIAAKEKIAPDIIWLLIDAGADIEAKNDLRETPLHRAARYNNLEAVKALVAKKANPNATNTQEENLKKILPFSSKGKSPLYLAQENDSPTEKTLQIIEFLEPLTDKSLWFVTTPEIRLKRAIIAHNPTRVKHMVFERNFGQKILNDSLFDVRYFQGKAEVIEELLEAGADVNARNPRERTALHEAAQYSNLAAVKLLLARNADPNSVDKEGKTALDLAREDVLPSKDKLEIIKILESVTKKGTGVPDKLSLEDEILLLRKAIASNKLSVLQQLLARHTFRKEALNAGLLDAAEGSFAVRAEMLGALLDAGADINVMNAEGWERTALHNAVHYDNPASVQVLLSRGANPNSLDNLKRAAVYLAQEKDDIPSQEGIKIIKLLKPVTDPSLWFIVTPEIEFKRAIKRGNKQEVRSMLEGETYTQDEEEFPTGSDESQQKTQQQNKQSRSSTGSTQQGIKHAGQSAGRTQQKLKKFVGSQKELLDAFEEISKKKSNIDETLNDIMGITTQSAEKDKQKMYIQWVKLHHPDRYPDEQLKARADIILQYLNQYLKNK
jgi:ankyrin repeat protein